MMARCGSGGGDCGGRGLMVSKVCVICETWLGEVDARQAQIGKLIAGR